MKVNLKIRKIYKRMLKNRGLHKSDDRIHDIRGCGVSIDLEKLGTGPSSHIFQTAENSRDQTHNRKDAKVDDDVEVGLLLDPTPFRRSVASIEHDLGVRTRENNEANNPRGISNSTATEKEFIDADWFLPLLVRVWVLVSQNTVVMIEVLVCGFGIQHERGSLDVFL